MQQDINSPVPAVGAEQVPGDPFSVPRSHQWPAVKQACLEKYNYKCAMCSITGQGLVQVHHLIPFQFCVAYGRPELEFNPENLIPLCEGPTTNDHHIAIGHLGDFQHFNENVKTDIVGPWKDLAKAAIEKLPDFINRRKWPKKPLSDDDIQALKDFMNNWYGPKPQVSIDDLIKKWWPRANAIAAAADASESTSVGDTSTGAPTSGASGS